LDALDYSRLPISPEDRLVMVGRDANRIARFREKVSREPQRIGEHDRDELFRGRLRDYWECVQRTAGTPDQRAQWLRDYAKYIRDEEAWNTFRWEAETWLDADEAILAEIGFLLMPFAEESACDEILTIDRPLAGLAERNDAESEVGRLSAAQTITEPIPTADAELRKQPGTRINDNAQGPTKLTADPQSKLAPEMGAESDLRVKPLVAKNIDNLRLELGLSYRALTREMGRDDHKAVAAHCRGKRRPEVFMIELYACVFSRLLNREITPKDLRSKDITAETPPNIPSTG
jgi:hypothetical protein